MDFIIFVTAMVALIYGADFVIKESERIALHYKISHFVIGATLIAFGTSLPEMAASMTASCQCRRQHHVQHHPRARRRLHDRQTYAYEA
jgi:Ca2+/Na+ antiporter